MRRSLVTALLALALAPTSAGAAELPPDFDMYPPWAVHTTTDGGSRWFIAFESRVRNVGPGPVKVLGDRSGGGSRMAATQVLLDTPSINTARVARAVPGVGEMEFSGGGGHNHWHLLGFQDYNLLSVPDLDFVAPTRKTGFCLWGLDTDWGCGLTHPELTTLGDPTEAAVGAGPFPNTQAMGMAVWGYDTADGNRDAEDFYGPSLEGQDIEITGVPDGRYCVSFVVNPTGKLVEAQTSNNGASTLIDLSSESGQRRAAEVGHFPDGATCGLTSTGALPFTPPALTTRKASQFALSALRQKFFLPTRVSRRCRITRRNVASCAVSFHQRPAVYRGTVTVKQKRAASEWRWYYRLALKRVHSRRTVTTKTLLGGVLGADKAAARRALVAPAGVPAPVRRGAAWADERLPRFSRAALAERRQIR